MYEAINLPDGYNGHFVECICEPIKKDGNVYKLQVKDSYLIKWCTRNQWEDAMWEAYTKEAYQSLANEIVREEPSIPQEEDNQFVSKRHSEFCECGDCYDKYCKAKRLNHYNPLP